MYTKHAEFKAGLIVLIALTTLLGFLFVAGGSRLPWASWRHVTLRFEQGFAAPKVDDPIYMNGFELGRVGQVRQEVELREGARLTNADRAKLKLKPGEDGKVREIYILAVAELPRDQRIPKGTTGQISVSLTGGRTLALLPGLSHDDLTDEDTVRNPIPIDAAGDISSIQKSVEELVQKVGGVVETADLTLNDVRDVIREVKAKVAVIDLKGIQDNVLDASKSLRETLGGLGTKIDDIAAKVSGAAGSLQTLSADGSTLVKAASEDVKEILANLKALSAELKGIASRAGPKIDAVLDDIGLAAKAATAAIRDVEGVGARIKDVVGDVGADLHDTFDKIERAGRNIADITEDLKAHPWKLLNKPEGKEIAFENLRDAASSYVRAAEALQEAARDLKALEARADLPPGDRKRLLEAAYARVQGDLTRYQDAAAYFTKNLQQGQVQPPR